MGPDVRDIQLLQYESSTQKHSTNYSSSESSTSSRFRCGSNKRPGGQGQTEVNFDSHHGARTLPSLMPGDVVWLPDRQTEGVVQDEVAPQSFQVVSPDGSYRRNRQDIIQFPASQAGNSSDESESSESVPTAQLNQSSEPRRSSRVPRPPERLDPSWVKQ